MLQFMRQRASSWMIKAILSIIVLAFIFMGVGNFRDRNQTVAATVNGEKIGAEQFQDTYYNLLENVRRQFGSQLNDDLLNMLNLKERAMDQLISETLLLQQAEKLGLQVSDEALSARIRRIDVFQQNGAFNNELYTRVLQRNRMTPEMFEQQQRKEMLTQNIRRLVADSVKVSEDEARRWYNWQQAEVAIKAALFQPDHYGGIKPTEEELTRYFDENKESYKTEEKIRVTYSRFVPGDFTSAVKVDDTAIEEYYEDHQELYRSEKTVEVSHILLKAAEDAPEAIVAAKQAEAGKIYDMIMSGKDFAACARQYSEDVSGSKGGVLGAFKKQELAPPFAEQAFSMKAGEISPPVRTQFGWHIIQVNKVTEAAVTPLAQVKADITNSLSLNKARELAYEAALSVFDAAVNKNSVREAAEQLGRKTLTTPPTARTGRLEEIPESGEFIRQAFELPEGEISDVVEVAGGYYVFQVDQRLAPEVPELAAVRERVMSALTARMQAEKAEAAAGAFLKMLQEGTAFDTAVEKTQARLIATGYFGRQGPVPEIGNEPEISKEAFLLNEENRFAGKVIAGQKGYYVISLEGRRLPEEPAFAGEKEKTMAQLMQFKKQEAFADWLESLKAESEITRDERFLK